MTEKEQIIVDGVDVSGCAFLNIINRKTWCDCITTNIITESLCSSIKCPKNPNCYFKQLTRKTAECEKLKEKWNIGFQKFCDKDNELQLYKQALEEVYGIIVELLVKKDVKHLSKETNEILNIISKAKDGNNE